MKWEELKQLGVEYTSDRAITYATTKKERVGSDGREVVVGYVCFREKSDMDIIIGKLNGELDCWRLSVCSVLVYYENDLLNHCVRNRMSSVLLRL